MKTKQNFGQIHLTALHRNPHEDDQDKETKFDLYVQSRRVKQITYALDGFIQSISKTHPTWLIDNQDLVEEFLEELMDDSMLVLDGVELDAEGMELSVSLMSDIRRALSVIEQMVDVEGGEVN